MGWNVVKGLANMCGYVLDKSAELLKEDPAERRAQLLEAAFGESVYVANLTFAEIRGWLNRKKSLLRNGGKAVIIKLDDEKFSEIFGDKLGDVDLGGEKYISCAVMDGASVIKASLLVKYDAIDAKLEGMISDEPLVVEG